MACGIRDTHSHAHHPNVPHVSRFPRVIWKGCGNEMDAAGGRNSLAFESPNPPRAGTGEGLTSPILWDLSVRDLIRRLFASQTRRG